MKCKSSYTMALVLTAALAGTTWAQEPNTVEIVRENSGVGTTSAEFLLFGSGARGMALAPAFSALVRDVEALYYNPANLPLMDGMESMVTVMPYIANTNYIWAGLALPVSGGEYGFGLSIANFGFSNQPLYTEVDQDNASELSYSVSETVVGASFAHAFIDRFTGGFTLKFIADQLGQTSAFGFAVDVGTNYHTEVGGRPIAMSFVIQNLGTALTPSGQGLGLRADPQSPDPSFPSRSVDPYPAQFEAASSPLPVSFRVGLAYDALSASSNRLTLMGEFNELYNNNPSFGVGSEFEWKPENTPFSAALRGSYAYQPDNHYTSREQALFAGSTDATNQGLDGLVVGGGLKYRFSHYEGRADYAFRQFGVLGSTNVFSLGFAWR